MKIAAKPIQVKLITTLLVVGSIWFLKVLFTFQETPASGMVRFLFSFVYGESESVGMENLKFAIAHTVFHLNFFAIFYATCIEFRERAIYGSFSAVEQARETMNATERKSKP